MELENYSRQTVGKGSRNAQKREKNTSLFFEKKKIRKKLWFIKLTQFEKTGSKGNFFYSAGKSES